MTLQELPEEEEAEEVAVVAQQVAVPQGEAEGRHLAPWYWYWYCYWRWYCLVSTLCATALIYILLAGIDCMIRYYICTFVSICVSKCVRSG